MKRDIDTPCDIEIKPRICENADSESAYNESYLYLSTVCGDSALVCPIGVSLLQKILSAAGVVTSLLLYRIFEFCWVSAVYIVQVVLCMSIRVISTCNISGDLDSLQRSSH
jgi:hypothetical protein